MIFYFNYIFILLEISFAFMVYVRVIPDDFVNVPPGPPGPSYPIFCYGFKLVNDINMNNQIVFIIQITLACLLMFFSITLLILACLNNYLVYNDSKKFICNLILIIIFFLLFSSSFLLKSNC